MTESSLSKAELKYVQTMTPYLVAVQALVDDHIIRGNKPLTAVKFQEIFYKGNACNLPPEEFVMGFRVLVRVGKVTGIEGVRKVGYRKIKGAEASVSSAKPFVQEPESVVVNEVDDFAEANYDTPRNDSAPEEVYVEEEVSSTQDPIIPMVGMIIIDEHRRLVPLDKLNWSFQERKNSGWVNRGYFVNYAEGLRVIASKLMDDEIRAMPNCNLSEVNSRVQEAEKKIVDLLKVCTKAL